jgi:hypothetical protein
MKKRRIILVFKEKNMGIVGKKTDLISTSGDKLNVGDIVELSYKDGIYTESEKTIVVEENGEQFLLGLFEKSNEKHEYLAWEPILVKKFFKIKEDEIVKFWAGEIEYKRIS